MSQTDKKPKLSDVARENNTAKASRFSATMIPPPPLPRQPTAPVESSPEQEPSVESKATGSLTNVIQTGEADFAEGRGVPMSIDELRAAVPTDPTPVARTTRKRSGALSIADVISPESPKGEPYPRQVRISEIHHKLLRKLAFTHDVTINHVMYNLLDLLDQADQRDQPKGD